MYKKVFSRHPYVREPGAESRAVRWFLSDRSSHNFDAAGGLSHSFAALDQGSSP